MNEVGTSSKWLEANITEIAPLMWPTCLRKVDGCRRGCHISQRMQPRSAVFGGMGGFSGPGGWRNDVWIIGSMGDLQDPILDGGSYQKIWPNIWYSTFTYPPLNRILKISHWLMVTWKRTSSILTMDDCLIVMLVDVKVSRCIKHGLEHLA